MTIPTLRTRMKMITRRNLLRIGRNQLILNPDLQMMIRGVVVVHVPDQGPDHDQDLDQGIARDAGDHPPEAVQGVAEGVAEIDDDPPDLHRQDQVHHHLQ